MMMFALGLLVGFVTGFFGFLLYVASAAMNSAPEGYEDEYGWHPGCEQ